jgi:hypothetical protein
MALWGLLLAAAIALFFLLRYIGRMDEKQDQMQQVLDDIYTAKDIRDRLRHDQSFARRVREKFTRKLL